MWRPSGAQRGVPLLREPEAGLGNHAWALRGVEDTAVLDTKMFDVLPGAGDGRARSGLAWRWGVESAVAPLREAGLGLLLAGVVAILAAWVRIPNLGPRGFGAFRVVLALAILGVVWGLDVLALPFQQQRALGIPGVEWLRPLEGQSSLVVGLRCAMTAAALLFGAGAYARLAFGALTAGFLIWSCIWGMSMGTHPLGPLPLTLLVLVVTPWQEGAGVDRWRARGEGPRGCRGATGRGCYVSRSASASAPRPSPKCVGDRTGSSTGRFAITSWPRR